MPDPERKFLYNIPKLNRWFAITSLILLASIIWLIQDDYSREWKGYQREFRSLEIAKTQDRIRIAEEAIDPQELQSLEEDLEKARTEANTRQGEINALERQLAGIEARSYRATQDFRFTKAELSQAEYFRNEALRTGEPDLEAKEERVARIQEQLDEYDDQVKGIAEERRRLEGQIAKITGERDRIQNDLTRLLADRDLLRKRLRSIDAGFITWFRNLPILDFMNPSLRVQQVVLSDIVMDLNFALVPKVDRCTSCHLGIDRTDYQEESPPFNSHPNLDLMVASASPHPKENFGCTGCHQGLDRATSFQLAAHSPASADLAKAWKKKYHWKKMEHWEYRMWPPEYVEASCNPCHSQQAEIPQAEKFNRGKHLFEELGCHGCHKVRGFEDLPKVGPDLRQIASKTTPDWIYRWVGDPKAFRPTTKMPKFFFTANRSGADDESWNHTEIDAITTYLLENSERPEYPPAPAGNPERGRYLAHQIGCQGCHLVIDESPADLGPDYGRFSFGPSLRRVGEKVNAPWLYQWLRDPRRYHPATRMPDLRLSRRESADLTAYLMSLRDPDGKMGPAPAEITPAERSKALDEILKIYFRRELTKDQADERIGSLSPLEKKLIVGERLISKYGCAGCHEINGFETAQRVGVELSQIGHKNVRKLDFGALEIPHTVHDWLYQKMKDSRIFDLKREVAWQNKLRMPDFALTDDETQDIVTMLLGQQKESMRPRNAKLLSATEEAVEAGRHLVKRFNCRGCHILEGKGGDIQASLARELPKEGITPEEVGAYAPPNLYREGSKVQPDWLFRFLKAPNTIRPWLRVRMPTFQFSDREATILARYFALADEVSFPFSSVPEEPMRPAEMQAALTLFSRDYFNCTSCHQQGSKKPEGPPSGWAPDFALAGQRLRPAWITEWLLDPQALQPGTRMPGYFSTADSGPPDILEGDEAAQIEVLKKYLFTLGS